MDGLLQDDLFGIITVGYEELLADALHRAVLSNDVETLERLLKEPSSDINCLKYGDNMLISAIRHERTAAALWLVEHGIDCDFETCHLVLHDPEPQQQTAAAENSGAAVASATAPPERKLGRQNTKTSMDSATKRGVGAVQRPAAAATMEAVVERPPDLCSITCRQLAYEKQLWKVVSAIDAKKGADRKPTRRYPDMRHYSRLRSHRRLAARAERANELGDVGGGGSHGDDDDNDASEDGQLEGRLDGELSPAPPAASFLDDAEAGAAREEPLAWPLPQTADLMRRCQLVEDERTASPTIFWRRSTLTKSAKIRQRLEDKLLCGADGCGELAPPPLPPLQQQQPNSKLHSPAQPLAARTSDLNKEISRLLSVAAAAASAIGASRPHSSAREKTEKAFSHQTIMRAHSSKRTKQPTAS